MKHVLFAAIVLTCCSCNSGVQNKAKAPRILAVNDEQYTPPAAGAIVAADSMPVTDDPLNHFNFSVKIKANEYSSRGTYSIAAAFGPNTADGMFTMPKGGSHLEPVLKKGTEPYSYVIGFKYKHKFYDYYLVKGSKSAIEIKNIKAYAFQ